MKIYSILIETIQIIKESTAIEIKNNNKYIVRGNDHGNQQIQ